MRTRERSPVLLTVSWHRSGSICLISPTFSFDPRNSKDSVLPVKLRFGTWYFTCIVKLGFINRNFSHTAYSLPQMKFLSRLHAARYLYFTLVTRKFKEEDFYQGCISAVAFSCGPAGETFALRGALCDSLVRHLDPSDPGNALVPRFRTNRNPAMREAIETQLLSRGKDRESATGITPPSAVAPARHRTHLP